MNPFLVALLSMLVRQAFIALAGALGLSKLVLPLIDQYMTQFQQLSVAIAVAIVTVGYAAYRKLVDRQKLVTALSTNGITTERAIESIIRHGGAASVSTPKNEIPT